MPQVLPQLTNGVMLLAAQRCDIVAFAVRGFVLMEVPERFKELRPARRVQRHNLGEIGFGTSGPHSALGLRAAPPPARMFWMSLIALIAACRSSGDEQVQEKNSSSLRGGAAILVK